MANGLSVETMRSWIMAVRRPLNRARPTGPQQGAGDRSPRADARATDAAAGFGRAPVLVTDTCPDSGSATFTQPPGLGLDRGPVTTSPQVSTGSMLVGGPEE